MYTKEVNTEMNRQEECVLAMTSSTSSFLPVCVKFKAKGMVTFLFEKLD